MYIRDVKTTRDVGLFLTQTIRQITVRDVLDAVGILCIFLLLYAGLFLAIGDTFLPGDQGAAWAVLIVWLGGHIGAFLSELVGIPAPIGMICVGLFLRNVSNAVLISGLKPSWSKEIRGAALAIIFLRSGLELDLQIFKKIGIPAVKLLFVPGLIEAFFDGGLAIALFGFSPLFGFALGFILKAIGPALVIQLMFELQQKRLGTANNMPTVVVAAASFDDMVAITGYTIFINIAVQGDTNKGWHIAQGPLSVVFGVLLGLIAALLCSITLLWNNVWKRVGVLIISALAMKYFFDEFHFESGGALAALTLGLVVKELWRRKLPKYLADKREEPQEIIRDAESAVVFIWRFILMPLLFTLIGTSILFSTLDTTTISKACILVISGLGVRMIATLLVMKTCGYSWKECLWFAIAWTPKATVQAALGGLPADAAARAYPPGNPQHKKYQQWGSDALTTSVFEILISGTLGSLLVHWLSPLLLTQESEQDAIARQASVRPPLVPAPSVAPPQKQARNALIDVLATEENLNHGNLVEDHVERLEALSLAMIQTATRDGDDQALLYGQRLRAGVRALMTKVQYRVNPKDVIGAEAYREAVEELSLRRTISPAGLVTHPSRMFQDDDAHGNGISGQDGKYSEKQRSVTGTRDIEGGGGGSVPRIYVRGNSSHIPCSRSNSRLSNSGNVVDGNSTNSNVNESASREPQIGHDSHIEHRPDGHNGLGL